MGIFSIWRSGRTVAKTKGRGSTLACYQRMRTSQWEINRELMERLTKDRIHEGAKRLGILDYGGVVFGAEAEEAVLGDYCFYDVRRKGRNMIEQILIDSTPDCDSDEMIVLKAMQHAVYTGLVVESVHRGLGVTVRDLLSGEKMFVADLAMSRSVRPGIAFATRLLKFEEFTMTTGAALPFGQPCEEQYEEASRWLARFLVRRKSGIVDPAPLIRECLQNGAAELTRYENYYK